MQHAPITTPITDKLASMPWIRWFRQLVDRVEEIKDTADAPAWDTVTGKPTEFPPSEHRHEWTDLDDVPSEFPPEPHTHSQYLTEETDPTVPAHVKDISEADISRWDAAGGFVSVGGCQLAGVTGNPLGDLSYIPGTGVGDTGVATILGTEYATIVMPDGKEWLAENVRYTPLQTVSDAVGSKYSQQGANDLNDALSATGWRVPTNDEWYAMGQSLQGATWVAGSGLTSSGNNVPFAGRFTGGVGAKLKNPSGWSSPYNIPPYVGSDDYGFSAIMQVSNVQKIAIWRCYVPDYTIYTPVWFVADSSDSFLYENGWADSSGIHIRLVRDYTPVADRISTPAFSVRLFDDSAFLTDAKVFDIPAQEIPVPGYDQRYYLCAQRSGDTVSLVSVPQADAYTINMSNIVPLWRFEIHGTEIHQIHYDNMGDGLPNKQEFAQLRTEPYRLAVEGGFAVTLGVGRSLTMTGAEVFFGHHRVTVGPFSSATDTVHDYYHVSGVWDDTETASGWAWPNTTYDDGTDLVTMGNNKWGCLFIYRSIGDSREIFTVRGRSEANTLDAARLIGIPPTPDLIQWHTMLIGRILFEKSASVGTFEQYSPASFARSTTLALDDLSDVSVLGAAEASVLQKNLSGEWRGDLLPWDDMRHLPGVRLTGANQPTFAAFGTSMFGWRFAAGELLACDSEQIPHAWAGTPIRPHVHFSSDNGGTGNIVWEVKISTRSAKTGSWSAEQTITKTWTGTLAALGGDALDLWDSPGVTLVDTGASTLMKMRIRMVSKTFTGNVFLDGFDSHIQHKRLGTINEFGPL